MSDPLRSLNTKRKLAGKRSMPFRSVDFSAERELFEKFSLSNDTRQVSTSREEKKSFLHPENSCYTPSPAPDDAQLRMSMMTRISQLEKQVLVYSKEVINKDKKIKVLEEKIDLYKKYQNGEKSKKAEEIVELETKCEKYLNQIKEMENFLADYGMVWIGEDLQEYGKAINEEQLPVEEKRSFIINFDRVIENIRELNELAGEGKHQIHKTSDGARLKLQESIPLTLYANGIIMFKGPFRSYTEVTTERCLADIADGYFPSELQSRYPDGVPIQVTDCRHTTYVDPRNVPRFPGEGRILGRSESSSVRALHHASFIESEQQNSKLSNVRTLNDMSHPRPQNAEEFLSRLPNSVLKDGKIIGIREDIKELIGKSNGDATQVKGDNNVVEGTRSLRSSAASLYRQHPSEVEVNFTTIRVKSEDGNSVFEFKMKYNQTIADLRNAIDEKRPTNTTVYDVATNFPKRRFDELEKTLYECGLVPNAAVILKPRYAF